ncbi:MAG TPA: CRISPR-associated protein [Planktothrix sp. UBA8407]|jgi:CRISPR-associated protein (Cas_Cmr3).|nr:CRISPR-associated protein [Planktothrix sp. UBA8407]
MFKYLITIHPLGLMYGSSGGFLSPENLVGCSREKFPPDAATLSGLFFSANKVNSFTTQQELRDNLYVAGPFWSDEKKLRQNNFYLPIPRTKVVSDQGTNEWKIEQGKWNVKNRDYELESEYFWQEAMAWNRTAREVKDGKVIAKAPWKFVSMLHPKIQAEQRQVQAEDGLFLEYAVQLDQDACLVYLSTHELPSGWYRFGGENHLVEINSLALDNNHPLIKLLNQPIQTAFALITPAVWGSNRLSFRYPQNPDFPKPELMLTDRAVPYRYRAGGRMGRGRYAVSAGSVYVLEKPLNLPWWNWSEDWFPKEGYSLKKVGCGLCLPLTIQGVA